MEQTLLDEIALWQLRTQRLAILSKRLFVTTIFCLTLAAINLGLVGYWLFVIFRKC